MQIQTPNASSVVDEAELAASEFALYHRAILRKPGPNLDPKAISGLLKLATELDVEPGLIILSTLLAHKATSEGRPFWGTMLQGPYAKGALTSYRQECTMRFGAFDASTLAKVTKLPPEHDILRRLSDSEKLAASWGVNATFRGQDVSGLYAERELALDPWWLATEVTYQKWVQEDTEPPTPERTRHRHRALTLCTKSKGLRAVRRARGVVALAELLHEAGKLELNADRLLVPAVITRPDRIWRGLAVARATLDAMSVLRGMRP